MLERNGVADTFEDALQAFRCLHAAARDRAGGFLDEEFGAQTSGAGAQAQEKRAFQTPKFCRMSRAMPLNARPIEPWL